MKRAIIIQTRMGSTRLPGKVLKPIGDTTVLGAMLNRVSKMNTEADIIVATTTDTSDDAIVSECRRLGHRFFRGHPTDLIARHLMAAKSVDADVCIKIPSDCPLIDPRVIDYVLGEHERVIANADFVTNLRPATWPDGQDVEVMPTRLLELANNQASKEVYREHTTPFFWDQPDRFVTHNVVQPDDRNDYEGNRWTLDYPEDYEFIRTVFAKLGHDHAFSVEDILSLTKAQPDIRKINAKWHGHAWFVNQAAELSTQTQGAKASTTKVESKR